MSMAPLVLVVEDSPSVRETMVRTLEISGFRVRAAGRAMDAVALARKEPPDLILTDVQLPDLDGASAAAYLKDDPAFAGIPVLLVSVLPPQELEEKKAETGAVDILQKPFSPGELVRRVRHWIAADARGGEGT
jgi:CheY-like chemotaxis protein